MVHYVPPPADLTNERLLHLMHEVLCRPNVPGVSGRLSFIGLDEFKARMEIIIQMLKCRDRQFLALALNYVYRIQNEAKAKNACIAPKFAFPVAAVCLMLAHKFLVDGGCRSRDLSRATGILLRDVNTCERMCLDRLQLRLWLNEESHNSWLDYLQAHVQRSGSAVWIVGQWSGIAHVVSTASAPLQPVVRGFWSAPLEDETPAASSSRQASSRSRTQGGPSSRDYGY
jgi:hypothetical protein